MLISKGVKTINNIETVKFGKPTVIKSKREKRARNNYNDDSGFLFRTIDVFVGYKQNEKEMSLKTKYGFE